ncbi:MAG: TIR domain-containing protein [Candidatus Hodarchaeota archaeon]
MAKIYPSFSSDDYDYLNAFLGMIGNPNNPVHGTPMVERRNLDEASESEIKNHLRPLIKQADVLVLLVGQNTHSRRWVDYEIDVAENYKIPIFATELPVSNRGGLPARLKNRVEIVPWNSRQIQSAIDRHSM